jgi:hypothetical protein
MLVPIPPGLLQQDDLIDAGVLEVLDVSAEISGRADAGRSLEGARQAFRRRRVASRTPPCSFWNCSNRREMAKRKNSKPSIPRPTASSRSACSENADTIAILALTLCPSGTHASLLMVS